MYMQVPEAISDDDLPLTLPETNDFKPSGSPESPLANIKDWVEFTDEKTGVKKWASACRWSFINSINIVSGH